jgi:hypothetical protein
MDENEWLADRFEEHGPTSGRLRTACCDRKTAGFVRNI